MRYQVNEWVVAMESSDHRFFLLLFFNRIFMRTDWAERWFILTLGKKVSLNRKSCTFYILHMIRRWRKCNSISRTDRAYELSFDAYERVNVSVSISKCISHAIWYTTTKQVICCNSFLCVKYPCSMSISHLLRKSHT